MEKIQVVILCGGKGTRLLPLTQNTPKVLVDINGKSTLEHNLDKLLDIASEIILIVGYLNEKIIEKIGDEYKGVPIKYITQKEQLGTGDALICAKELLKDRFLVMYGDDVHSKNCIDKVANEELAMAGGTEIENLENFGVLNVDENDYLIDIEEKPKNPLSDIANIGLYLFDKSVFNYKLEKSPRGEYELTDYLNFLVNDKRKIKVIKTDFWIPVGNHEQLKTAKVILF
jgi:NDP-sugar pyrophosphorylase family protein